MLKIAIVEDDAEQRELLKGMLERDAKERGRELEIALMQDGADLVECYARQYHILFLDIEMPITNGLKAAAQIREQDEAVRIIFLTNYANHAIDGYEVSASAFLVKPASYPTIARVMDKLLKGMDDAPEQYLVLNNSREMQRIPLSSIDYIESVGHYVKIHGAGEAVMFLSSLKVIEKQLEGQPFFRCASGVIVSIAKVEAVKEYQVLVAGSWLPVSRNKKRTLMDAVNGYLSGMRG